MGCDIHLVLEKKWNGGWVGTTNFPYVRCGVYGQIDGKYKSLEGSPHYPVRSRNYELFATLAGVRGSGPDPKGMPEDASELASMEAESWDGDGHSHSWCSLKEYVEALLASSSDPERMLNPDDPRTHDPYYHYFGIDREHADKYRVVFWFDS